MSTIHVKRLFSDAKVPMKAHTHDAGYDLFAYLPSDMILHPMQRACIPTGIAVSCAPDTCWQIWARSGLAIKHGIDVLAGLGDSGYIGEVGVVLINLGKEPFVIHHGDRIAQLVHLPLVRDSHMSEVKELDQTTRGTGGFGSTGLH